MKQLITFLLCLLLSINNYAQNDIEDNLNLDWVYGTENNVLHSNGTKSVLDSILTYEYETDWQLSSRLRTENRDEFGHNIENLVQNYESISNSWNNYQKYYQNYYNEDDRNYSHRKLWDTDSNQWIDSNLVFKYFENGKRSLVLYKNWDLLENSFTSGFKTQSILEENGEIAETIQYKWNVDYEEWDPNSKEVFSYDENGVLQSSVKEFWGGYVWFDGSKKEYEYDLMGNNVKIITYQYSGGLWHVFSQANFAYNDENNRTKVTYQNWNNEFNEWKYTNRYKYEYDSDFNQTLYFSELWDDDQQSWQNRVKTEYTFNEQGRGLQRIKYDWDNDKMEWIGDYKYDYSYNEDNIQTSFLHQNWDIEMDEWKNFKKRIYYYSEIEVSTNELNQNVKLNIFPNPGTGKITIESEDLGDHNKVQIYNFDGTLVFRGRTTHGQLDLSEFSVGCYSIHILTNEGIIVRKYFKI